MRPRMFILNFYKLHLLRAPTESTASATPSTDPTYFPAELQVIRFFLMYCDNTSTTTGEGTMWLGT